MLAEAQVDDDGVEHEGVRYFQSPEGRIPLRPVDTGARWKTAKTGKASGLQYLENIIVHLGGFILSRGVTHASERVSKAVAGLLEGLPLPPVSLAADTAIAMVGSDICRGNRGSPCRFPSQAGTNVVASGDVVYHGDHLMCPQRKILRRVPTTNGNDPKSDRRRRMVPEDQG